jgi:hypothetical protein
LASEIEEKTRDKVRLQPDMLDGGLRDLGNGTRRGGHPETRTTAKLHWVGVVDNAGDDWEITLGRTENGRAALRTEADPNT